MLSQQALIVIHAKAKTLYSLLKRLLMYPYLMLIMDTVLSSGYLLRELESTQSRVNVLHRA